MSTTVLSDDSLFNGGKVDSDIISDYQCLRSMVNCFDEYEEIDSEDINEFFKERDANKITYLFRLSLLNVGYDGLSRVSKVILKYNKDHINEYLFKVGNELMPYYRYFEKCNDYKAIATIFEQRGVSEKNVNDFKKFIHDIGLEKENRLLNEMPSGDYEKVFFLAHD